MLYTENTVKDNIRIKEGKRVFYLGKSDQLTPGARDWLRRERIEILPADHARPERYQILTGGYTDENRSFAIEYIDGRGEGQLLYIHDGVLSEEP